MIATERGWNLYVGGNGGSAPATPSCSPRTSTPTTLVRYLDRYLHLLHPHRRPPGAHGHLAEEARRAGSTRCDGSWSTTASASPRPSSRPHMDRLRRRLRAASGRRRSRTRSGWPRFASVRQHRRPRPEHRPGRDAGQRGAGMSDSVDPITPRSTTCRRRRRDRGVRPGRRPPGSPCSSSTGEALRRRQPRPVLGGQRATRGLWATSTACRRWRRRSTRSDSTLRTGTLRRRRGRAHRHLDESARAAASVEVGRSPRDPPRGGPGAPDVKPTPRHTLPTCCPSTPASSTASPVPRWTPASATTAAGWRAAEQNGLPRRRSPWRRVGKLEGGDHPTAAASTCRWAATTASSRCARGLPDNAYEKLRQRRRGPLRRRLHRLPVRTWGCPYNGPVLPARPAHRHQVRPPPAPTRGRPGCRRASMPTRPTPSSSEQVMVGRRGVAPTAEAGAPGLPSAELTLSTTRIELPAEVPDRHVLGERLEPPARKHPHWPVVWFDPREPDRGGRQPHGDDRCAPLRGRRPGRRWAWPAPCCTWAGRPWRGRPCAACAGRWLSREVAALGAPTPAPGRRRRAGRRRWPRPPAVVGVVGVYASARLYVVPGRPAWNTRVDPGAVLGLRWPTGPLLTGRTGWAVAGPTVGPGGHRR